MLSKNTKLFLWLLGGILFSSLPVIPYLTLHTTIMDLGLTSFRFYNINNGEWQWLMFGHTKPFEYLYSFLYSIFPINTAPQILLFVQGLLLFLPAYWIRSSYGWVVTLAYMLYFPLWFNLLFDFHIDHLSILFLCLFFLFIKERLIGLASLCAVLLALVKEPFALQTIMCGVYMIGIFYKTDKKFNFYGLALIFFGIIYFYTTTQFLIPFFSGGAEGASFNSAAFSHLGSNSLEIILYIIKNPIEVLINIFSNQEKVLFLILIFGALGFIPLLNIGPLLVALPIFLICLLSNNENYYALGHHYTAGLIAPMIFAFAGGIPKAKIICERIGLSKIYFNQILIIGLFLSNILLSPSPISRLFWSDKVWLYNYRAYIPTERDFMIKQTIEKFIPKNSNLLVSSQNTINIATIFERDNFLIFPQGIIASERVPNFKKSLIQEVESNNVLADFAIIDFKRPWFLLDKGCDWLYGSCTNIKMKNKFLQAVKETRLRMHVLYENDGFIIFSKNLVNQKK